ncbi:DUF4252 domain-containing protein [Mangrovibacterium lignilyticum]|uniref:DUF4252 domain-containing protein n=1 Tax=Mangrovibacterium lignilyticum TaxID=2668052 RepID=UPI0013D60C55|nr:DUF4252 domain-containing protein [Mangrovibacterium lignilyticum]
MKTKMTLIYRLLVGLALLLPLSGMAQKSPVDKLFEKYANRDGMTTVNISGTLLSFAAQADGKSDEADMISKLKGIRILTVEDEDLNKDLDFFKEMEGDSFFKKNNYESLMEITETNEVVRFYARKGADGQFSELLLVIGGDDNTLISIQGMIDPANIGKITGALDIDIKP